MPSRGARSGPTSETHLPPSGAAATSLLRPPLGRDSTCSGTNGSVAVAAPAAMARVCLRTPRVGARAELEADTDRPPLRLAHATLQREGTRARPPPLLFYRCVVEQFAPMSALCPTRITKLFRPPRVLVARAGSKHSLTRPAFGLCRFRHYEPCFGLLRACRFRCRSLVALWLCAFVRHCRRRRMCCAELTRGREASLLCLPAQGVCQC